MKKILTTLLILIILAGGVYYALTANKNSNESESKDEESSSSVQPVKRLKIIDVNSDSRPYAIMINNINVARPYQAGLQDAYIVYELIVEGGISRMMGLFKDASSVRIGSVRSARHYYLDYALENDAIYVHWGQSPQAEIDIKKLNLAEISGNSMSDTWSFRDKSLNVSSEHTLFAKISGLNKVRDKKISRKTTNKKLLLNYSIDEYNYDGEVANDITIKYSNSLTNTYKYDEENKYYLRSTNGKAHIDYLTKKQYTFKNIIAYAVNNHDLADNQDKDRQEIENIGSGTGYYFSNGIATKIKWTKKSRQEQTKYETEDGKELIVNDGNTFIQIYPTKGSINFE